MGKAIEKKMGIDPNGKKKHTSKKLKNENRRGRNLKAEIKELRQLTARTSNEIYQRKQKKRAHQKRRRYLNNSRKQ